MKKKADLIIYNAKVYTVDDHFSIAACVIIKDGKILAVGKAEDLMSAYEATDMLDAEGYYVYPGFHDAHCHFLSYGLGKLQRADLTVTSSFDEVLELVKAHAETNKSEWIEGRGWDQNDWEVKEFPDRAELDRLFPERPVVLTRIDGHASLVNGIALRMAGITAETKVKGGEVKVVDGRPSGILIDNAMQLITEVIPENDEELQKAALLTAQEDCFAVGLSSVTDANMKVSVIKLIDSLQQRGLMKIRVNAMLSSIDTTYLDFMREGIYKTERLHVNAVKLFADGALGSRGACMLEPYLDDPGKHGLFHFGIAIIEVGLE